MTLHQTLQTPEKIPEVCRKEVIEWDQHVKRLGEIIMEILREGLGLNSTKLKEMKCLEGNLLVGLYYLYYPQQNLAIGAKAHTDVTILTLLLQDHARGLQVKVGGGWVDIKPIHGALVINISDVFQIISNGEYKSVERRVLANLLQEPRILVALFYNLGDRESTYEPSSELISSEKPSLYKPFTPVEALQAFFSKALNGKTLADFYRI